MPAVTEERHENRGHAARWRGVIDRRPAAMNDGFAAGSPFLGGVMEAAALAPRRRFRGTVLLLAGQATGGVCVSPSPIPGQFPG